jgi:hypothetical protein
VRAEDAPTFSSGELEQVVAPIALDPDSLLAQALMASTYPLEVVALRPGQELEARPQRGSGSGVDLRGQLRAESQQRGERN